MDDCRMTVYIGTYTQGDASNNGILIFGFNNKTGEIKKTGESEKLNDPSYLAVSGECLYAVMEDPGDGKDAGGLAAFKADRASGRLTPLNKKLFNEKGCCHVAVSEDAGLIAAANYGEGSVTMLRLNADGSLGDICDTVFLTGTLGPDKKRQDASHAHYAEFRRGELFVTDLGLDKVFCFDISGGRLKLSETRSFSVKPGSGPRHLAINGGFIYCLNELSSDISVFYDNDGTFICKQTISALPCGYASKSTAAAIHISADKKYLYASNRGHDSIAIYDVGVSGLLSLKEITALPGKEPRDFSLTPDGRFLIAASQNSDRLNVFCVRDGLLYDTGYSHAVPKPVCVKFL